MGRGVSPENAALEERISDLLSSVYPKTMTSAQIADEVGGKRLNWAFCSGGRGCRGVHHRNRASELAVLDALKVLTKSRPLKPEQQRRVEDAERSLAGYVHPPWRSDDVPPECRFSDWDVYEYDVSSAQTNPVLNRMHRKGLVEKTMLPWRRAVDWSWRDPERYAREEAEVLEILRATIERNG